MFKGLDPHEVIVRTRRILSMQRAIATVVLIAMLLSMVPFQAFGSTDEIASNDLVETQTQEKINNYDVAKKDIPIVAEDISKRSESEKHFRKQDGSYEVVLYDGAVHYKDGDEWKDIDNSLDYDKDTRSYKNKANQFDIKFPKDISSQEIKLKMADYEIDWQLIGSQSSLASVKDKEKTTSEDIRELVYINEEVIYIDVLEDIDLSYTLSGSKIKETFIVDSYKENISFQFEYTLKNLSFLETDEGIVLVNNEGIAVFTLDSLIMFDDQENGSTDIELTIEQTKKDTYFLTITPDNDWLKQASYPVRIDPTIDSLTTNISIHDTFITDQNISGIYYNYSLMHVGYTYALYEYRSLLSFEMPEISNQTITYAHLELHANYLMYGQINMYQNCESFNDQTSWSNKPDIDETRILDYYIVDYDIPIIFDITESVKKWQEENITSVPGFTFVASEVSINMHDLYQNNTSNGNMVPKISIGYESSAGLKDYWTYTSQNMELLGTGFISDYTGSLTWVRNDYELSNEYMPLSLSMIYNYSEKDINSGYGYGWKTNYNMQLLYDEDCRQYFLHKPDGELIYFRYLRRDDVYGDVYKKTYIAENGSVMKLTITFDGDNEQLSMYQLETKDNFFLMFENSENGRLVQLRNTETNHDLFVSYKDISSLKINTITDDVGNNIEFNYTTISYSTKMNLIQDSGNESDHEIINKTYYFDIYNNIDYITENYDLNADDNFTTITQLDYEFNSSHQFISAENLYSDQKIIYNYMANRVNAVIVNDAADKINQFSIDYELNLTRYISEIDQTYIDYSFDMYGHTVNVYSSNGYVENYKYAGLFTYYSEDIIVFDVINTNPNFLLFHHLLENSGVKQQQQNPIQDSSFEYQNQWSTSYQYINSVYYSTLDSMFGNHSLVVYRAIPLGVAFAYENVYLEAGSYTISGWIKNSGNAYNGSGACIEVSSVTSIDSSDEDVFGETGWIFYSLTFTINSARTVTVKLQNYSMSEAYFDQIQINEGYSDVRYNLVENSGFESWTTGWITGGLTPTSNNQSTDYESILGSSSLMIEGDSEITQSFYQTIDGLNISGETITVGGWAKADSVPNKVYSLTENNEQFFSSDLRSFDMKIVLDVVNSEEDLEYNIPFTNAIRQWQFVMQKIEVPDDKTVSSITIYGIYQGENKAYFDNFQVYVDDLSQSYLYNEYTGNIVSFKDASGSIVTYTYDETGEKVVSIEKNGVVTNLTYTSTDLIEEIETNNVRMTTTYDIYSKHIIRQQVGDENSNYYFTEATYQFDDQYLETQTNEFDNSMEYGYNEETGLIDYIVDANSNQVSFDYDDFGRIIDQYFESSEGDVHYEYIYNNNLLHEITVDDFTYTFNYNNFDQISSVEINSEVIVSYTYVTKSDGINTYQTSLIETKTYANGDYYYFTYNSFDQLKTISFNNTLRYEYVYDSSGILGIVKDLENNHLYNYNYDMSGKLETITDESENTITYEYDTSGRVSTYTYDISGIERRVYFHYNQTTGEYDYTTYSNGQNLVSKYYNYQNDSLRRLNDIQLYVTTNEIFQMTFIYDDNRVVNGNATQRIYNIVYDFDNDSDFKYFYTYDDNQNIISIVVTTMSGTPYEVYAYTYDDLGRLKRENIRNLSLSSDSYDETNCSTYYSYDQRGNIISIEKYPFGKSGDDVEIVYVPATNPYLPYIENYGNYELDVMYNDGYYYDDVYEIDLNESPAFSFLFYDLDNQLLIYENQLYMFYDLGDINTSIAGYYLMDVMAYYYGYYDIEFSVMVKVGEPMTQQFIDILPEESITYNYDGEWKDQLESYEVIIDGVSKTSQITYDLQGNPTRITNFYFEGVTYNHATLLWEGRQLTRIIIQPSPFDDLIMAQITYTYNDQSIRTSKLIDYTSESITDEYYEYILDGDLVLIEIKNGTDYSYYTYDVDGRPISITHDGEEYYYIYDLQGNVIGLIDGTGERVVEYKYDAWGNIISITNSTLANVNPYRYRGYRYDEELGYYYLLSRYYNPEVARFINMDDVSFITADNATGINLYAYCANNPVMYLNSAGYNSVNANNSMGSNGVTSVTQIKASKAGLLNRFAVSGEVRSGGFYGKGEATFLYGTSQFRFQWSNGKTGEKSQIGYFTKISILNAAGQIGFEAGGYGVALKGVADVGTATLLIGFMETDKGWFAGLSAEASIASARGGIQFDLGQFGIEIGGTAKFMTTGEFQLGVGSDGFIFAIGNPGPGGVSVYIRFTW